MIRLLVTTLLILWPIHAAAQKITRQTLAVAGETRAYYVLAPERADDTPAPLIVLLHGSNRDGRIMVEQWQRLAKKEGIVLAGPDARQKAEWNVAADGPHFLHAIAEAVKSSERIDPRRVYLFGHSAGAIHALHTAVLESEYFAAAAVHAGLFMDDYAAFLERAPRKIPLAIWVGTNDRFFPVDAVRATRDLLSNAGFPVQLSEIKGHTHDYYSRASEINEAAWDFLRQHHLGSEPKYQEYEIAR